MREWIMKIKINFTKELKEENTQKNIRTNILKKKPNILIKWWNWKQLKVYKRDKRKMKKNTRIKFEKIKNLNWMMKLKNKTKNYKKVKGKNNKSKEWMHGEI
jgi:hypothetical protein